MRAAATKTRKSNFSDIPVPEIIRRVESSPKFKNLTPEQQEAVRGRVFDRFVGPYYKSKGVPYTKEEFLSRKFHVIGEPSTFEKAEAIGTKTTEETKRFYVQANLAATKTAKAVFGGFDWLADRINPTTKHEFNKELDPLIDYQKKWLTDHYNNSLISRAVNLAGEMYGQAPAYTIAGKVIKAGEGLMKGIDSLEGLHEMAASSKKAKFIYDKLNTAASFYLGSRLAGASQRQAASEGISGGVGDALLSFMGKILGVGGSKLLTAMAKAPTKAVGLENAPLDTVKGKVARASAKMMNELSQQLGYKDFWDAQSKNAGGKVYDLLKAKISEASKELSVHNRDLVGLEAAANLREARKNPEFQKVESLIGDVKKEPTEKAVVDETTDLAKARVGKLAFDSTVGAASSKSMAFEDNVSKAIKRYPIVRYGLRNIVFEDRGHKMLATLALLDKAPQTAPREKLKNFMLQHLKERYPGLTPAQLKAQGDVALEKIRILREQNPGAKEIRFYRQTTTNLDHPFYGHELELYNATKRVGREDLDIAGAVGLAGGAGAIEELSERAQAKKERLAKLKEKAKEQAKERGKDVFVSMASPEEEEKAEKK